MICWTWLKNINNIYLYWVIRIGFICKQIFVPVFGHVLCYDWSLAWSMSIANGLLCSFPTSNQWELSLYNSPSSIKVFAASQLKFHWLQWLSHLLPPPVFHTEEWEWNGTEKEYILLRVFDVRHNLYYLNGVHLTATNISLENFCSAITKKKINSMNIVHFNPKCFNVFFL